MSGSGLYAPREAHQRPTWAILTVPLVWLFIFAGVWLSGQAARLVGLNVSASSGRWQDNLVALFASGPVLLFLWLWLRFFERRTLAHIGLGAPDWKRFWAGAGVGATIVTVAVAAGLGLGIYEVTDPGAWFDHLTPTWFLASVLAVAGTFVQASVTEALFRGWMLDRFAASFGTVVAVFANIAACVWIQGGDVLRAPEAFIGAVNFGLMAWLLSLFAIRDGSLWSVCGLHTAWNLVMGWGLSLNIDGGHLSITPLIMKVVPLDYAPVWLTGGDFGPDGSVLFTLVVVLFIAGLLWRGRGRKARPAVAAYDADELYDH